MTNRARLFTIALVPLLALGLSGCGNSAEPTVPPASANGTVDPSDPATLVSTKCSMCHTLDRVNQADKDLAGWTTTVERMQRNGLVVTDSEKTAIIDYLTNR